MKVIKKDLKAGRISFRIEVPDDLFYLADIIGAGDVVTSRTKRRVEVHAQGDVHRAERIDRKPVTLGVKVDDVEFDKNVDRIRVLGKIVKGPESIPTGDFHTLNLKPGMTLTITKETWTSADFALISDAAKIISVDVMLLAIEDGCCSIGALRNYGIKTIATITKGISGKDELEKRATDEKQFFQEVLDAMKSGQEIPDRIIVAGPGFVKDSFFKFLKEKDKEISQKVLLESVSIGGERGLQEIIKRGIIERVVKEWKVQSETEQIEKLLTEIKKNSGLVSYGFEEVNNASNMGAVSTLMISNTFLKTAKVDKDEKINSLLKMVQDTKGEIMIVSGEHEMGKQLEGLGGLAAIHRYKI